MEPKKNPKIDLHNKRGVIFNFSLVLSLLIVISAFRWQSPIRESFPDVKNPILDDFFVNIPSTDFDNVPEKPKTRDVIKPQTIVNNPTFTVSNNVAPDAPSIIVDPSTLTNTTIEVTIEPEKPDTTEWTIVETPPQPVGGLERYFQEMKTNLKYPRRAVQTRTEGKVYVQFTIEPTGELSNLKVVKGIGQGCDEEARRVISLSKWHAGRQRGRPVRVRMIQQVSFQLNSND